MGRSTNDSHSWRRKVKNQEASAIFSRQVYQEVVLVDTTRQTPSAMNAPTFVQRLNALDEMIHRPSPETQPSLEDQARRKAATVVELEGQMDAFIGAVHEERQRNPRDAGLILIEEDWNWSSGCHRTLGGKTAGTMLYELVFSNASRNLTA